ncbi:hypothetical protein CEUSTIGMA_g4962.t1 [Chlamydomonas eustigma]|uniref:TatD related DNase n=1 Tax=Chlamydomonas eustigma TaxID=1157962 RepID=A0A250X370_9CHLO|nr:hypothetical protein CEUSTIGMA_g4962.t1 [Chlamydomonas eustigma]|eukprot:GAX77518.1 hypothetical protein CEUSTIGMA_g4962.t1 [Chlamydomonas eustigma]
MFGGVDRGGSREGKKSLRKNKIGIDAKVKSIQKGHAAIPDNSTQTSANPPPVQKCDHAMPIVDCGVQLINRQFDRDQLKVLQRAANSGVQAFIAYTTDFDKIDALTRLARENVSVIYCMVGVHSDMIKRSSDKLTQQRLDQLRDAALRPEVVAVLAGLDFSRDVGIRFAQERALSQQMELAAQVGLPLVLYQVNACEALLEHIKAFQELCEKKSGVSAVTRVAIYNFSGSAEEIATLCAVGCYITISGRAAAPGEVGEAIRVALRESCPLDRLLLCSDAPYCTPQNIQDVYVREGRNEPSNLPHVLEALSSAYGVTQTVMATQIRANSYEFFSLYGLESRDEDVPANDLSATFSSTENKEVGMIVESCADEDEYDESEAMRVSGRADVPSGTDNHDVMSQRGEDVGESSIPSLGQAATMVNGTNQSLREEKKLRRVQQPDVVPLKKPTVRSFLSEHALEGDQPRVTYACRSCGSVLFSELDVRPHEEGFLSLSKADFKRASKGKAGRDKGRQKGGTEDDQLCSLHFIARKLPWMQLTKSTSSEPNVSSTPSKHVEESAVEEGLLQEGRLDCPCCCAKLGKYSLMGALACSCGAEVTAPVYGLLKARLDIKDSVLDLTSAIQSNLQLYDVAEADGGLPSSSSENSDMESHKKKKKAVKGRGNTSNFSSFRNKTFGVPATKKASKSLATQQASLIEVDDINET